MIYTKAHVQLFDRDADGDKSKGLPAVIAALKRPLPSKEEYPDEAANEYAVRTVSYLTEMRSKPLIWSKVLPVQGARLVLLERIFDTRHLKKPEGMETMLREIKGTALLTLTFSQAGLNLF